MLDVTKNEQDDILPSPVSTPRTSSSPAKLSAAAIIPIWIVLSSAVIIYNNYLYNTLQFRFPVFLVTWHLTFAVSTIRFLSTQPRPGRPYHPILRRTPCPYVCSPHAL